MKPKKPPIPTSPARTSAMTEKAVTWHHEATRRLAVSGSHSSEGLCWVVVKLPYVPLHRGQACARPRAGRTARLIRGNRRGAPGRAETPRHGGGPSQARRGALVPVASRRPRASQAVAGSAGVPIGVVVIVSVGNLHANTMALPRVPARGGPADRSGGRPRSDLKGSEKRCPSLFRRQRRRWTGSPGWKD